MYSNLVPGQQIILSQKTYDGDREWLVMYIFIFNI